METKEILKSLRKSRGFSTMQDLCSAIGMNFSTYQNYESGKRIPTADILIKLADFYGVTTDYLLGREKTIDINIVELVSTVANFNELEKDFFSMYISLTREEREKLPFKISQYIRNIVTESKENQSPK